MEDTAGYGFRPTEEELVGIHLRHKLEGNASFVHEFISEVDICSFDPWNLRFQSKYKSADPMWYFFSRIENKYGNGDRQNRTTNSGKWKINGLPVDIIDNWGIPSGFRGKTGSKKVLSFIDGRYPGKTSSDWIIHEFHCTVVPKQQRTYVISRLHYKGDDPSILSAYAIDPTPAFVPNMTSSEGSVVNQSFQGNAGSYNTYPENDSAHHVQQFNENFNMQLAPQGNLETFNTFPEYYSAYLGQHFCVNFDLHQSVQGNIEPFNPFPVYDVSNHDEWMRDFPDLQQQVPHSAPYGNEYVVDARIYMQENYSAYRPKKIETGVIADDCSDTETGSMPRSPRSVFEF